MTTAEITLVLAPALRDKFDFSVDSQFDDWAELSVKAALAFKKRLDHVVREELPIEPGSVKMEVAI